MRESWKAFSAAAGATEVLRGWKVVQKIVELALCNVAVQGIGSRGRALAMGPSHCDYWHCFTKMITFVVAVVTVHVV